MSHITITIPDKVVSQLKNEISWLDNFYKKYYLANNNAKANDKKYLVNKLRELNDEFKNSHFLKVKNMLFDSKLLNLYKANNRFPQYLDIDQ